MYYNIMYCMPCHCSIMVVCLQCCPLLALWEGTSRAWHCVCGHCSARTCSPWTPPSLPYHSTKRFRIKYHTPDACICFFCYQHFLFLFTHNITTWHLLKTNKTKHRHILHILKVQSKGREREGREKAVVDKVHRSSTWVKVQIRIIKYYSSKSTAFSILLEWKYKSTRFFMYLSKKVLIDLFCNFI